MIGGELDFIKLHLNIKYGNEEVKTELYVARKHITAFYSNLEEKGTVIYTQDDMFRVTETPEEILEKLK